MVHRVAATCRSRTPPFSHRMSCRPMAYCRVESHGQNVDRSHTDGVATVQTEHPIQRMRPICYNFDLALKLDSLVGYTTNERHSTPCPLVKSWRLVPHLPRSVGLRSVACASPGGSSCRGAPSPGTHLRLAIASRGRDGRRSPLRSGAQRWAKTPRSTHSWKRARRVDLAPHRAGRAAHCAPVCASQMRPLKGCGNGKGASGSVPKAPRIGSHEGI